MQDWRRLHDEAPDLARRVEALLRSTPHHILATVRADGSPRVSGSEVQIVEGELAIGMMHDSRKARDLRRDGRFALHANPGDGSMEGGDAKVAGTATEIVDPSELAAYVEVVHPPEPFHVFRLGLSEVVVTSLHPEGDRLVIEIWRPGEGVRQIERQ